MIYFVLRRKQGEQDPLALVRINSNTHGDMRVDVPRYGRFGYYSPVERSGKVCFNLMYGEHEDVGAAVLGGCILQQVTQAEWETFDAFELYPVLKLALAAAPRPNYERDRKKPGKFTGGAFGRRKQRRRGF